MHDLTHKNSLIIPPGPCPELEEIAAFADGRLSAADRIRVMEHLAACEDCRTVFAETVRFQEDQREAGGEVVPFGRRRGWLTSYQVLLPVAAAALLAVAVGLWLYHRAGAQPPLVTVALVSASLDATPEITKDLWGASVKRGPGDEDLEDLRPTSGAVRLGALLVELRLAILARNVESVSGILSNLHRVASDMPFFSAGTDLFTEAARAARVGELPDLAAVAQWEAQIAESVDRPYLTLGEWAEAGRLAAGVHEASFFAQPENLEICSWWRRPAADLTLRPKAQEALVKIEENWPRAGHPPAGWKALQGHFADILQSYGASL